MMRSCSIILAILVATVCAIGSEPVSIPQQTVATFSIIAHDPKTGETGIAVQSKFLAVGSVVPWADAEAGAIATQAYANTRFGPEGLKLLKDGDSAKETLSKLIASDPNRDHRQVAVIDLNGGVAAHTGKKCNDWAGHLTGDHFAVQGNLLAGKQVVQDMKQRFEELRKAGTNSLSQCLIESLEAGQAAGGDKRGRQSAALYVVKKNGGYARYNDRFVDLRVDDHPTPIKELKRLLKLHKDFRR